VVTHADTGQENCVASNPNVVTDVNWLDFSRTPFIYPMAVGVLKNHVIANEAMSPERNATSNIDPGAAINKRKVPDAKNCVLADEDR